MVEWKKLGEITRRNKGIPITAGQMSELASKDGNVRVFAAGSTIADIDESRLPKNCAHKLPSIIVKSRGYIDFEFYEKPFTHKNEMWSYSFDNKQEGKFIYYFLTTQTDFFRNIAKANSVKLPQLCVADTDNFSIPIPSLEEQTRIVGILDTFTSAIDNLKEQIAQRRKQYEYYRDQLLDLEGKPEVEMKTIGDIAKYRRGSFPQPYGNKEWYDGEGAMPFVQVADVEENVMRLKKNTKQFISRLAMPKSVFAPIGTIIVTLQGSIGKVAITQYDSYIDRTLGIFESFTIDINKKYFALQLEKIFAIKKEKARGGTIKTITKEEFTNFTIPLPPLSEQQRIVSILDTFETSIQNLEAQLKEREKQYEYYRNKLLMFE